MARQHWTDEMYAAAISAVSDKIAQLDSNYPRTPEQIALSQAATALRHERVLLDKRAGRVKDRP